MAPGQSQHCRHLAAGFVGGPRPSRRRLRPSRVGALVLALAAVLSGAPCLGFLGSGPRVQGAGHRDGARGSAGLRATGQGLAEAPAEVAAVVPQRRTAFAALAAVALLGGAPAPEQAAAFAPSDLGMADTASTPRIPLKNSDPKRLQNSIYLISRVQEATAQQERLVSTGKFKDAQRNNIKMALKMMLDNYQLGDQIVIASGYLDPDKIIKASQAGNEAIDTLQTAQEYFAKDLKVAGLTDEQRTFIVQAMQSTRSKLDGFLAYLPEDVVQKARRQVEEENELNMKEFVGQDGGITNPVKLPWKT